MIPPDGQLGGLMVRENPVAAVIRPDHFEQGVGGHPAVLDVRDVVFQPVEEKPTSAGA